jgi:CDP-diacylglycerol--glycerol-3-phosphate 3-phosphatidyltransferase
MSASQSRAHDLRRGDSLLSTRAKEAGRALLSPIVRLAVALHLTPNTITVIGFLVVVGASALVGAGNLLAGALMLTAGSLLDAVDGALARATGAGSTFGSFLDSTLDRAAEAVLYAGIVVYFLNHGGSPTGPVLLALVALAGSFMVSYTRARAEGIGLTASVGLAPRMERLVLTFAGIGLAGLGFEIALIVALGIVAVLSVATTAQRIWHVHRLSSATPAAAIDQLTRENQQGG